jgi:adenine-specific DNA-methyltransferase
MAKKNKYTDWTKEDLIKRVAAVEKRKKYGLVWDEERDPEKVVLDCKDKLPILKEIKSLKAKTKPDDPEHILIEGDNYHALSVLNYTHEKAIDVIYIDPPYNTGAKDWKYNNNYVDENDSYRHSKWLTMMNKRIVLAKKLLKPKTGVFIVTTDEHEVHRLRMLLEQIFSNFYIQMVTTVTNPKGVTQGRFSRVEEYIIYCFAPEAFVYESDDNLLNPPEPLRKPRWKGLLRSGTNARRADRKNMFYPVLIDEEKNRVVGTGASLPFELEPKIGEKIDGFTAAWPIRTDGKYGNWGVGYETLRKLIKKGYVSLGRFDEKRRTWGISYISEPNQRLIENGNIKIIDHDKVRNVVEIEYLSVDNRTIKTMWHRSRHDAGAYGTDFISNVLGGVGKFTFPKSLYSTKDAISAVVKEKKDALVLDFFAGSGTTLNSVNLLNAIDGGKRQCFLVTNNEVSAEEAKSLREKGFAPGDKEWEKLGICHSVTWPRSKFTILGKRDDGIALEGEYYTGNRVLKEISRKYYHLQFIDIATLSKQANRKQLAAILNGITQDSLKNVTDFFVPEIGKGTASILTDEVYVDKWIEALVDREDIITFYIITKQTSTFNNIKTQIEEMLGNTTATEEVTRPMKNGFSCNLKHFKTEFVPAKSTDANKEKLTKRSVEMLCLRENTFDLVEDEENIKIFKNHKKYTGIIFDQLLISKFKQAAVKFDLPAHVYVFSLGDDDFADEFEDMKKAVKVCSIPEAILRVYRRIFK